MKNVKPLIGIGSDLIPSGTRTSAFAYTTYIEALKQAGAIPVVIPPQPENTSELLAALDGIVLAGGFDCDPAAYGEEQHETVEAMDPRRQENDLALAKLAYERGVPTLGICLGMQVMNVARGGTLIQDIASQRPGSLIHESDPSDRIRHDVEIDADSRLARIIGAGRKNVNSSHHQAIGKEGEDLRVTARASDGIIEAIEDQSHRFFVGVQWHPEDMEGEPSASTLFRHFVDVAAQYQLERRGALVS
jgi:putative glutamine amidotransferase